MRQSSFIRVATIAVVATVAATLSGCAFGSSGGGKSSQAASTKIPSDKITLTLATEDTSGLTQKLVEGFEKLHPNVTIKVQTTAYSAYTANIQLRLASSSPPDLSESVVLGNLVKHNLLLPLDDYAKMYGWTSKVSKYALDEYRMGTDQIGGHGSLYAVSSGFALTGLYYNKAVAKKLGIDGPPKTMAEMDEDLAKAKAAGMTGLEVANQDGHAAFLIQQVADAYDQPETVNNWIFGVKGSTFNQPGVLKGAQKLIEWAKAGYINSNANSNALTQSVAEFSAGKTLFFNDGNWDAASLQKGLGTDLGFAAFPAATAGGPVNAMVGGTAGYQISAKSKHPDVAAAFLDYSIGADAAKIVASFGNLPNDASAVSATEGTLSADFNVAWKAVQEANGLYGYWANAYEASNTTLTQTTQELIGGTLKPEAFISQVQSGWEQAHQS